jgi:hypothetical protein
MQAAAADTAVTMCLMSHKLSASYIQDRMPRIKVRPATGVDNNPKPQ